MIIDQPFLPDPSKHRTGPVAQIQRRIVYAMLTMLAVVVGCGGPETKRVPLVRVAGTVTLDGKTLEKAVVVFESEDASFSQAVTDARGRYDLRFDSNTRGVTLGPKTVRISMNRRINGLNSSDEGAPDDRAGGWFGEQPPELIPDKYNTQSTLTTAVTSDTNTVNFDLLTEEKRVE